MNTLQSRGFWPSTWLSIIAAVFSLAARAPAQTYTNFITIDDPLAIKSSLDGTYVQGIYNNIVVGYYFNSTGRHGFFHTLGTTNYTTLDDPAGLSGGSSGTGAYGISGENIVGYYSDQIGHTGNYGFVYNLGTSNYTTLTDPAGINSGVSSTEAFAIDGNNVVGSDSDNGVPRGNVFGFLAAPISGSPGQYSYSAFAIPIPGSTTATSTNYITRPYGLSGENVVGTFEDTNGYNPGFIYNLGTSSLVILTNASGAYVVPYGISGSNVVGSFSDPNSSYNDSGFLYTIGTTNWITIRDPLAVGNTFAEGISGQAIVGNYYDSSDVPHGFVVGTPTVPALIPFISAFYQTSPDVAVGGYVLSGTNGVPGAAYAILGTTNLTLPFTQWAVITTNTFDADGDCGQLFIPTNTPMFFIIQETP